MSLSTKSPEFKAALEACMKEVSKQLARSSQSGEIKAEPTGPRAAAAAAGESGSVSGAEDCFGTFGTLGTVGGCAGTFGTYGCGDVQAE